MLKGSYTDHTDRFETGDLDFSDEDVCLIAITGDLKLRGMLGWLISPCIRL